MKRTAIIAAAALCLVAETSRDAYRAAYREWREADPNLERDSGTMTADFEARVKAVGGRASKYGAARGSYVRDLASELAGASQRGSSGLDQPLTDLAEQTRAVRDNIASETAVVKRNLDTFSKDPDPGIQELRLALERESAALASLAKAITERQTAADAVKSSTAAAEQARAKALNANRELAGAMTSAIEEAGRETAVWTDYYGKLAAAARTESPAPVPVPSAPPAAPAPSPRGSITPLPLTRYTGAWTFPSGGLFHGPQPEFLDLVVHEENGRVDGTLFARFKVAQGGRQDPVVRFDFSGELKNTRNQSFTLETSDGVKGNIELIPGPAFNLLEINFQTEPKPGKIQRANALLVKK